MAKRMARLTREEWSEYQEERGYKSYERWYDKQKAVAERSGQFMKSRKLDFDEWLQERNEVRADLKAEVEAGRRAGIGNVNQYIARSQTYDVSYKAARRIRQAIREKASEFGEEAANVSMRDIMFRSEEAKEAIFNVLDEEYHRLKAMGYSAKEAKKEISRNFFGSR